MTEAEWLAAKSPEELLLWLGAKSRRRRSPRKNGLFVVACGERVKSFMPQAITIRGLELAERMAEGVAEESDCDMFLAEFLSTSPPGVPGPQEAARVVPFYAVHVTLPHRIGQSSEKQAVKAVKSCVGVYYAANDIPRALQEMSVQTDLLRDIVGNPFRPVVPDSSCLKSSVVSLARQMYECRDFAPMPTLADALQDVGCQNADILNHCRSDGPHVRGCWVVDLLLGKA